MIEVQDFILKYKSDFPAACAWLKDNSKDLNFKNKQDFLDLLEYFRVRDNKDQTKPVILMQVVKDNADKIIPLFKNIKKFDAFLDGDADYFVKCILIIKAKPLFQELDSLEEFFKLVKKPNWYGRFGNDQDVLLKVSHLFKSWEDILTYADEIGRIPDLFKTNPLHFASLFSNSDQIIKICEKNRITAYNLVRSLDLDIAHLYTTSEQLQPLALMNIEAAENIAKARNISIFTRHTYTQKPPEPVTAPLSVNKKSPQIVNKAEPKGSLSLKIIGGFIAVVGIAAVALALILPGLNLGTFILAGVGGVAALIGMGVFAAGAHKGKQEPPEPALVPSL